MICTFPVKSYTACFKSILQTITKKRVEKKLQQNYWQIVKKTTVPLLVSSIGRTNRKYLIGIHCILLLLFASVLEIYCVMCDPTYKNKIADVVTQNFFQWVNKLIQHGYGTNNVKSDHKYSVIHMLINYFCSLFSMSQNLINWGSVWSWWQNKKI